MTTTTTQKQTSEDYLSQKVKPIFDILTEEIIKENPTDIPLFVINWLKLRTGYSTDSNSNNEHEELKNLRKEIKRLKKKYDFDKEMLVKSGSASEEEEGNVEEDDQVESLIETQKQKNLNKGQRSSVSAEVYGSFNPKKDFTCRVISKTEDQIERIQTKVLKSFIFSSLDEKDLKSVVDAMEEHVCEEEDVIIRQGDSGSELFIIEKGTFDCFKQFKKEESPVWVKGYVQGESFGELALLYNAPRAATIKAKQKGILWKLDRETFNMIVKESAIKRREQYENFLRSVDILKSIDSQEISQICEALREVKYMKGENIIRQNEEGEVFYIIKQGEAVAMKRFSEEEDEKEVKEYKEGGYFGELALIRNEPRAASIVAKTNCVCLLLDRKSFIRLLGPIEDILKRNSEDYLRYMSK